MIVSNAILSMAVEAACFFLTEKVIRLGVFYLSLARYFKKIEKNGKT
jgi:hypothetical protein